MKKVKYSVLIVLALLGFWVLSYCVTSAKGSYHEVTEDGGAAYAVWYPSYVDRMSQRRSNARSSNDGVHMLHIPLVLIDRSFVHTTVVTVESSGDMKRIARVTADGKIEAE